MIDKNDVNICVNRIWRSCRVIATFCLGTCLATSAVAGLPGTPSERKHASQVTITRDDWGIAHIHGKADVDAVFGMTYAQAEDDFARVEHNYLVSLGRLAEAEGENAIWQDLRQRLFLDPSVLKTDYRRSPAWLKALMEAWADGLNYYLATHPDVHPKAMTHFEPWMALSFTDGSIGGDIESAPLTQLESFYEKRPIELTLIEQGILPHAAQGSNGIAIGPSKSIDGHALLYINPHTSFFFRSELQMTSDQGLDAYGAVTWGQFFVYQGFNAHAGWMHTSSSADNIDEFAEDVFKQKRRLVYRYGARIIPISERLIEIRYRDASGRLLSRTFTGYATLHGPIIRKQGGKWISMSLMNKPILALEQSFLRTKAKTFVEYMNVAALKANSSNNTIFADDSGEIAYLHPQFIPVHSDRFDYSKPVDGSDPATNWKGLHSLPSVPHVVSPPVGWVVNTNNAPWTAAGPDSPKKEDFPIYMNRLGQNPRGLHALRILSDHPKFDVRSLIDAGFDSYLPAFARLIPPLLAAYDKNPDFELAGPIAVLRRWDFRWGVDSEATTLAVFWGEALWEEMAPAAQQSGQSIFFYMLDHMKDAQSIDALKRALARLHENYGDWHIPWGRINRFQRLDDELNPHFDDQKPSIPVPFTSARWGSLASFEAEQYPNVKRYYGSEGNSFVASVDFGPRVKAFAVNAGGESGDPSSPHFADQAQRYADWELRPVYFYPDELEGHIERMYRPGNR